MKLEPKPISRPLSVGQFADGQAYEFPNLQFTQPHLFSEIALVDQVAVKMPSSRGLSDYHKYIKHEEPDPDEIRRNEPQEKFSNLQSLVTQYPSFRSTLETCGKDTAHFLLVQRLQFERLVGGPLVLPETRFVVVKKSAIFFFSTWVPTIIQERVSGTALWDMYDSENEVLLPEWRPYKATLSPILSTVLNSPLRNHINWNIENLIFDKDNGRLYYVDLKPSTLFARSHNEHNIASIKDVFI